jgi:hypothetical protein
VDATVIEFDALSDAVGTATENHDLSFTAFPALVLAFSPTTQTLGCDWPTVVLASTISNLRKERLGT